MTLLEPPEASTVTVKDSELHAAWHDYLSRYEAAAIQAACLAYPDEASLTVQFRDLETGQPDLAERLLARPAQCIRVGSGVLWQMDAPVDPKPRLNLRVEGLPESMRLLPRQLRSEHLGTLVPVEGLVQAISEVRALPQEAAWECKFCANIEFILQEEELLQEPVACTACEKTGPWRLREDECLWVDHQILTIQERPDQLRGGAPPESRYVLLRDDLVHAVEPGDHVIVNSIPLTKRRRARGTASSTEFDMVLMAISIERPHHVYADTEVTPAQLQEFKAIAAGEDPAGVLASCYMPQISGMEDVKRAILYALVGSPGHTTDGKEKIPGNIHVLLVGDPGIAKSRLLTGMEEYAPRCTLMVGTNTSGAGIAAACLQDRVIGKWILEAGAAVRADGGVCCIDEMGHIPAEDLHHLHTIMADGVVRVNKAIKATLRADTTILAAMNPPVGERFDAYQDTASQIGIEAALLSRFDLVYCLLDHVDEGRDRAVARAVLGRRNGMAARLREAVLAPDMLRRYITHARSLTPHLTKEAVQVLEDYYVRLRNATKDRPGITPRNVDGLARLTVAGARLRLSEDATKEDAEAAIQLLEGSLRSRGAINTDGILDSDILVTGGNASHHDRIRITLQLVKDLQRNHADGYNRGHAREDDIVDRATQQGLTEDQARRALKELARTSVIYARGGGGTWAVLSG